MGQKETEATTVIPPFDAYARKELYLFGRNIPDDAPIGALINDSFYKNNAPVWFHPWHARIKMLNDDKTLPFNAPRPQFKKLFHQIVAACNDYLTYGPYLQNPPSQAKSQAPSPEVAEQVRQALDTFRRDNDNNHLPLTFPRISVGRLRTVLSTDLDALAKDMKDTHQIYTSKTRLETLAIAIGAKPFPQ